MRILLILSLLTGICACDVPHKKQRKIQYESWGSPSKTMRKPK
jgi:hypothetical protein